MYLFTSECVSPGHPDKLMDVIADSLVDAILIKDPHSRVAIEGIIAGNNIVMGGEVSTTGELDKHPDTIIREAIDKVGYTSTYKFPRMEAIRSDSVCIQTFIAEQSQDISQGVNRASGVCAGDQGMVFGMASSETKNLMPAPIEYARRLCMDLFFLAQNPDNPFGLDIKTQITVDYGDPYSFHQGDISRIHTIAVAIPHLSNVRESECTSAVLAHLNAHGDFLFEGADWRNANLIVNGTGRYVTHSSQGDSGVVGRKIVVDSFGGRCPNGGGAMSGKDYSKVDRTGVYLARHMAKNVVAAKLAQTCYVQMAYVIGQAEPVSIVINTEGTGYISDQDILKDYIIPRFGISVQETIDNFNMTKPSKENFQYTDLAYYGHFWNSNLPWEKLIQDGQSTA